MNDDDDADRCNWGAAIIRVENLGNKLKCVKEDGDTIDGFNIGDKVTTMYVPTTSPQRTPPVIEPDEEEFEEVEAATTKMIRSL